MKTLYIECGMGAAGDMLISALSELHPDGTGFVERLNDLHIPGVEIIPEKAVKCGITGTHIRVLVNGQEENADMHEHPHEHSEHHEHGEHNEYGEHHEHHEHRHHHSGIKDMEDIINSLAVNGNVRKNAIEIFRLIAEAEGHVHGREIDNIHFHEVGTMDAVADIVGVCMLIDELAPDKIIASPVHVGSGYVRCAHGILPVPAPATAYILRDVPIYGGEVKGELCTPTGAAILKHFADGFGAMPVMRVFKIGYGMGTKDFDTANCLRAMMGETSEMAGTVAELMCNIDDMTGEQIGFAAEKLLRAGALDVFTTPVGMKKNRPGILLTCMCRENQREEMIRLIFKHTSTIGVREHISNRYTMRRRSVTASTEYGSIRAKLSEGYGVKKVKPEYEDMAKIAEENNIALSEIKIQSFI